MIVNEEEAKNQNDALFHFPAVYPWNADHLCLLHRGEACG